MRLQLQPVICRSSHDLLVRINPQPKGFLRDKVLKRNISILCELSVDDEYLS